MAYPSAIDSYTPPSGTSLLTNPDHAGQHASFGSAIVNIETTLGTTAGTSVIKNFAVGDFAARINASNVLQQSLTGTLGMSAGSITGQIVNTGTVANGVYGTATIQGGTANGQVIGTAVTTGAFSNGNITGNGTINWSNGDVQFGTLTGNGTLVYSNQKTWQRLTLTLYQDATGGRTLVLPTSKYPGGVAPTYGTTASAINALVVIYDGTNNLTQTATAFA